MKLYKNEIGVAERDDMTYIITTYGGKYFPRVNFRPEGRRWSSYKIGNKNGYKTMRGAMNAITRDAKRYTLIEC